MMKGFARLYGMIMLVAVLGLSVQSCGGGGEGGGGPVGGDNGTISNPISVGVVDTTATSNESISAAGSIYYTFTTDACGGLYTIALTNLQSDLDWLLYVRPTYDTYSLIDGSAANGTVDEIGTSNLSPNTTYYLKVMETDGTAGSYTLTITPAGAPTAPANAPTNPSVTAGNGKAKIVWDNNEANATAYNIYWSTSPGVTTANGTKIANVAKSVTSTTSHIQTGMAVGTYYYVVTGLNVCSEGPASTEASVSIPATEGAPLLSSNFDDGTLQGWTATGTWGVTTAAKNSGSYSVSESPSGNYANGLTAGISLSSPVLDLTGTTLPSMTFYHRYDTEQGRDYGIIAVSTDGGNSIDAYLPAIYTGIKPDFVPVTIDLSPFKASNQVVVFFEFTSDSTVSFDGWYIDDIVVTP